MDTFRAKNWLITMEVNRKNVWQIKKNKMYIVKLVAPLYTFKLKV